MPYTYEYPRPSVTVDCVIFGVIGTPEIGLYVLMIHRKDPPFKGSLALPGGFVQMNENLDKAAHRELKEETNLSVGHLEQLYTFGDCGRDPRGRVISIAYMALVNAVDYSPEAGSDAASALWLPAFAMLKRDNLAFDHHDILATAVARLQAKVRYAPIGFGLLPKKFTLARLQNLYEAILGKALDKRNFRKRVLSMGILRDLGEKEENVSRRPGNYYSFDKKRYEELVQSGFNFEL